VALLTLRSDEAPAEKAHGEIATVVGLHLTLRFDQARWRHESHSASWVEMNSAPSPMRALVLLLSLCATALAAPVEQPNIVFILADDQD